MEQLIRSLQDYFSCTLTYWEGDPPRSDMAGGELPEHGDILPVYHQGNTRVWVAACRLQGICTLLWEFPGIRQMTPHELEHLLICSRLISMKLAEQRKDEEIHLYRQLVQLLGKRSHEGVILLDTLGKVVYQNNIARSRRIVDRYHAYMQQSEDKMVESKREHTVYLEGTAPLQLDITNMHTGDIFLGRVIHAHSGSGSDTTDIVSRSLDGDGFLHILGKDVRIVKTMKIARKAAATDATILLRGESGTGKEQFARAIHGISKRRDKPFIAINCAAIPENLLESELFGYEEGSFTGANKGGKIGKIEAADKGTIFLDEIGDMPLHLQAKLLRVLQNREFERVGGTKSISVDVRFISATHRDLHERMREGAFRPDLFYRLNVIPIHIPALREHPDDIVIILNYYLKKYALQTGRDFSYFSYDALRVLLSYQWPGNIRELENVVQYCMTMSGSGCIELEDLPPGIVPEYSERTGPEVSSGEQPIGRQRLVQRTQGKRRVSRSDIDSLLEIFGDDTEGKRRVAEHLGVSLATLYRRLNRRSS